ncbi:MAG: hypothetical protein ACRYFS_07105 [Janthinobacterium lividum]
MNSTLTLTANVVGAPVISANVVKPAAKSLTVSQLKRTLVRKWDMLAVIGLMVSSAAYGVFALTQMTGF